MPTIPAPPPASTNVRAEVLWRLWLVGSAGVTLQQIQEATR